MGRKDNHSNFLDVASLEVLERTSEISGRKYPHVSQEEFFSEGWMRVIRFHRTDDTQNLQRQCLQCMRRYAAQRWIELGKEIDFDPEVIRQELYSEDKDPLIDLMAEECLPCLNKLNKKEQQLIEWRLFKGMSFVEMGKKLKCNRTTVFMRYKRSIKKLRNFSRFHLAFMNHPA